MADDRCSGRLIPEIGSAPAPRRWAWRSGDDSYSVEVAGGLISWTDLFYDERLGDFQNIGRSQTVEDFRGYGPMAPGTPPEVVTALADHLGVTTPLWAQPVSPEVARQVELAQKGDTSALLALATIGADLDAPDPQGNTPLWWAIARRHENTAEALITWGADVLRTLRYGRDMLMVAASVGGPQLVRVLLARGADPRRVETFYGGTALTQAIDRDQSEDVIRMLIDAGADVDHRRLDGSTPLSMARRRNRTEIVRALLEAGAGDLV